MFDWILEILRGTVEWREWGWNVQTFVACGAGFFSILQGVGVWKQGRRIWRDRGAPTISMPLFTYSMYYFFSFLLYGLEAKSITMTLGGPIGLLHIPLVAGVMRFERTSDKEKLFLVLAPLMVVLMHAAILWGFHETLLMVYLFGVLGFMVPQASRAWKSPAPKDLDPTFILTFMVAAVFWTAFAFVVQSWSLQVFNPLAFVMWAFMFTMWWKKGREPKEEEDPGVVLMRILYAMGALVVILVGGVFVGLAYLVGLI